MPAKLLIIENNPESLSQIKGMFESDDYEIDQATNCQSGLDLVQKQKPNVVIIDVHLAGKSGLETLKDIKLIDSGIAVIMMTSHNHTQDAIESMGV